MAIFNKYKNTFNNLVVSLNTEFLNQLNSRDWLRLIDKRIRNAPRYKDDSSPLLKKNYFDKDILIMLLKMSLKI